MSNHIHDQGNNQPLCGEGAAGNGSSNGMGPFILPFLNNWRRKSKSLSFISSCLRSLPAGMKYFGKKKKKIISLSFAMIQHLPLVFYHEHQSPL